MPSNNNIVSRPREMTNVPNKKGVVHRPIAEHGTVLHRPSARTGAPNKRTLNALMKKEGAGPVLAGSAVGSKDIFI